MALLSSLRKFLQEGGDLYDMQLYAISEIFMDDEVLQLMEGCDFNWIVKVSYALSCCHH